MYREIQWCFDMSITVKQMSLDSVFERPQQLQIPDVWWQLAATVKQTAGICAATEYRRAWTWTDR